MDVDHESMYKKGVLHRDISFGNILICDETDDMKDTGMLIDLDHAKYSAGRRAVPLEKETEADEGTEEMEADEWMEADEETEAVEGTEAELLRLFRQRRRSKLVPGPTYCPKLQRYYRRLDLSPSRLWNITSMLKKWQ